MAIKDLIASGIGFSPGKVQYIVTRGLGVGEAIVEEEVQTSGGAVLVPKKRKIKLTEEEEKGLLQYGKALSPKKGEEIEEIVSRETPEIPIIEERELIELGLESPEFEKTTLQEKIQDEEDIGLILALITAHLGE